jgi:hypothetical protein
MTKLIISTLKVFIEGETHIGSSDELHLKYNKSVKYYYEGSKIKTVEIVAHRYSNDDIFQPDLCNETVTLQLTQNRLNKNITISGTKFDVTIRQLKFNNVYCLHVLINKCYDNLSNFV